ncbi:MAG: DUF72 domain-containing protein [Sphingosinicella sp.]|uniref:DUF72 domain-containing protein n=1 Tax=Sphingosinicella sp. TaxID=1917971 RepID=UPI004037EF0A
MSASGAAKIHVGIGGWDFDPWRGTFFPAGLPKTRQLEYVGQQLTATEINATFYKLQSPALFERWGKAVPDGFKFAIKASRFCTNRKNLGDAGESIGKFCAQGFTELGDKLGPILWQLAPTKKFDPDEIRAFLALLPTSRDGLRLRHAIEVRHESFRNRAFVAMARASNVAIVFADHETYPEIADLTADFVYARLQRTREEEPAGYDPASLDRWASAIKDWAGGGSPAAPNFVSDAVARRTPREVFAFVIAGAKVRNPLAARALIERLG